MTNDFHVLISDVTPVDPSYHSKYMTDYMCVCEHKTITTVFSRNMHITYISCRSDWCIHSFPLLQQKGNDTTVLDEE